MPTGQIQVQELTSEEWSAREGLLSSFERAWKIGPRPLVEDYLPLEPRSRQAALLELVQTDMEYRLNEGESPRVEDYLSRFPALNDDPTALLELISVERKGRRRHEGVVDMAEFIARFPELGSQLSTSRRIARAAGPAGPALAGESGYRQRVGKYVLQEVAGRGAFGIVYRAHDSELDRAVALKVLRGGTFASAEEMDRLLREARSAGRLSHPNIVPIHEAGREGDTCYLVCEFIAGTTLAQRLASGPIPAVEAAALAALVAEALHHAHTQGVIHRDVKPSNILVDATGSPRLTDFGLAYRAGGDITLTRDGDLLGTPAYMPPEQARGEGHRADSRSDLYSLGAVLYEMLTGELPFRGSREMVLRQVLEEDPPHPRRLNHLIPRDLETICTKCLQKEPSSRYSSALALAGDLRRFLRGEPILARPISRVERIMKWSARNRWPTAFLLALVFGTVVSIHQAIRARGAQRAAHVAAETSRQSESEAVATLDFFRDRILAAARPKDEEGGLGVGATIRQAIDAALPEIDTSFAHQPLAEAAIRDTLGKTYRALGELESSIRQHEQALRIRDRLLGPDHEHTLISMNNLALAYQNAGRLELALPLQEEELDRSRRKWGSQDPRLLPSMNNVARVYRDLGRIEFALNLSRKVLAQARSTLGNDHPDTLTYMNNLATTCRLALRHEEALSLHEEALRRSRAVLGPDNPGTLICMFNLSVAYRLMDRADLALPLAEEELERTRRTLGTSHHSSFLSLCNLASAYRDLGRLDEALPRYAEALNGHERILGADHPQTLGIMKELAQAHLKAGHLLQALPLLREQLRRSKAKLGKAHPDTQSVMGDLARALVDSQPAEAEEIARELLAIRLQQLPDDWRTFQTQSLLGACLLKQHNYLAAEPLLVEGYQGMRAREKTIPPRFRSRLAEAQGRLSELRMQRARLAQVPASTP